MKNANFSMALMVSMPVAPSTTVTSLGSCGNWQAGVSSRSIWNISLVMPISTL